MTEQEIKQDLKDSGLFGSISPVYKCRTCGKSSTNIGYCNDGHITDRIRRVKEEEFSIPTANQAEAILAKMGLQMSKRDGWYLTTIESKPKIDKCIKIWSFACIAKEQRTLANNAALACKEVLIKRRTELERAIGEVK